MAETRRGGGGPKGGWLRRVRRLSLMVGGVVAVYYTAIFFGQRALMYPCQFREPVPGAPREPGRRMWLTHGQGRTPVDFYPGEGRSGDAPGPAVLFAKGNGDLIGDYRGGLMGYRRRGVSVMLVEYRGCGHAGGSPSYDGILSDHVAAAALLAEQPEVDPDRILYHGRSMGGGFVAALAERVPPAGLVLESAYTSIADFGRKLYVPGFLVRDPWDVSAALRNYGGPVVISHFERDDIIPYAMSEANRALAPGHAFFVSTVGHQSPMPDAFFGFVLEAMAERGVAMN